MTDIILGVLHMCLFPGGLFALAVGLRTIWTVYFSITK